jgi:hypothetical protein
LINSIEHNKIIASTMHFGEAQLAYWIADIGAQNISV